MSKTLHVIYDGEVLHPEEKSDLQPNTRYRVIIEEEESNGDATENRAYPLTMLLDLATDMGVADLAARHNQYAHSTLEDDGDSTD
jgi:predicted DNA-binding antitoxin AbrB/MazE fold protein